MFWLVIKKGITAVFMPPLSLLLLSLLGWGLWRRAPRLARGLLALAWLSLLVLSWQPVADALQQSLEQDPPLSAVELQQSQAIVVLGGGSYSAAPEYGGEDTVSRFTLERLRYAAVLQRQSGLPLLVTGGSPEGGRPEGQLMQAVLERDFQVPVRWVEAASLDTADNARLSAALLREAGVERVALVSQAWHLPRAQHQFELQGLTVFPAPTGFRTRPRVSAWYWWPSAEALYTSQIALREWLGRLAALLA
ncbi:YdcF family protein [Curvibacter sp. HBC61]|uniref:YdcF family protein n=1 Tax=Curvibacter cyanobacteriorum TaxID=3026422 RepID=A0ABT5N491_9BURK|nr:YdcF family protein [Curvibacter sp. HBC61]MDD0840291.1 YdcF family protein [Curvibacter sp. HBC61]